MFALLNVKANTFTRTTNLFYLKKIINIMFIRVVNGVRGAITCLEWLFMSGMVVRRDSLKFEMLFFLPG